ncbi:MAG: hypothetical protein R3D43_05130 [Tepidamorphaceae bacterium]|nr:hypothetical protein [Rhodobiaceae bacterium]
MTSKKPFSPEDADIHLSADEALVLFDLLSRWCEDGETPTPGGDCFESTAECAAIHGLLASLERRLVTPMRGDYHEYLREARLRLAPAWDYPTLRG